MHPQSDDFSCFVLEKNDIQQGKNILCPIELVSS